MHGVTVAKCWDELRSSCFCMCEHIGQAFRSVFMDGPGRRLTIYGQRTANRAGSKGVAENDDGATTKGARKSRAKRKRSRLGPDGSDRGGRRKRKGKTAVGAAEEEEEEGLSVDEGGHDLPDELELKARFCHALKELKLLGFIKASGTRKADHVLRTVFDVTTWE